ncbi:MAG: DegV family protein [Chloroflexi bacterium]|nr:DegV family protein [Chloroflexota bacterium]
MSKIAIVSDSACDLPPAVCEQYGIISVPLVLRFGNEEYLENQVTREEFWKRALYPPPYPQTSQVSTGMFEQAFAQQIEAGKHVICLTVTSKHSGTLNSAFAAAQRFPDKVTIFDTLSLSLSQGYQAIRAAEAAAQGHTVEEVMVMLESIRARTQLVIALDTIEYLRRGGRADQVMPVLERVVRVLSIKPLLRVVDGQLTLQGAARSREKCKKTIREELSRNLPAEMLIVLHTRLPDEASQFADTLAEAFGFPREKVMVGEAGPVLSSHAGPGVLAAAVIQAES